MQLSNRLGEETSPYLHQHRDNPVHWQPWNEETLALARRLGRPILLSIGYAACHWCHVMAHECFEDQEVADLMNQLFVNIKVDREERPDIDQIYMAALVSTGEQGGWPLTMFLTPDARPFWGGTYFPKHSRYGRPGFLQVLASVGQAWDDKRDEILSGSAALQQHVENQLAPASQAQVEPSPTPMLNLAERIAGLIDPVHGGLAGAPKFPNAPYMSCLWLAALHTGNRSWAESFVTSLEKMLAGGIYDHVGGGLCRYSTDEKWLVPHFEKMLYDNAQLVSALTHAHAATRNERFRYRIDETVSWLEREMLTASGAFASSLDADSEGGEGAFYVWTRSGLESVLQTRADRFLSTFDLVSPPNWEGDPILVGKPGADDDPAWLSRCLADLLKQRDLRPRPARDDKVLTDWNGLTIRALSDAARHFRHPAWLELAKSAFAAVAASAGSDGRLPHSVNADKSLFPALSSDYAAMINAAVSLAETTGDLAWLHQAQDWAAILRRDHGDDADGYYLTSAGSTDVPVRVRGDTDDPVPSATSQIIEALVRLATITSDTALQEHAWSVASAALSRAANQPHGQAGIFVSAALASSPRKLVTVDVPGDPVLASAAARHPDPRRVDIAMTLGARPGTTPLPASVPFDTSRPAAWICSGQTCQPPIADPARLEDELTVFPAWSERPPPSI